MLATQIRSSSRTLDSAAGQMLPASPRPRITPNMTQLSKRFPALGFTIDTGGPEYFEVLLAVDRSLFDPANAGRRRPQNFYASREHSGLIKAMGASAVYLVPPAVLNGFLQVQPRPSAVYYTLIVYRSPEGREPVFAHPPETLPAEAPSVMIAADFQSQSFSAVLGIALNKLQRVGPPDHDAHNRNGHQQVAAPEMSLDADADAAEGEDGFNQNIAAQSLNDSPDLQTEDVPANGHYAHEMCAEPRSQSAMLERTNSNGHAAAHEMPLADDDAALDYDDGYGPMSEEPASWGEPQSADYLPEAGEPEALEDDEESPEPEPDEESGEKNEEPENDEHEIEKEAYDDREIETNVSPAKTAAKSYDENLEAGDDYGATAGYGDEAETLDWDEPEPVYEPLNKPPLTIDDKLRIINQIAQFESSGIGTYSAINADGEFEGKFANHPAQGKYHIGLSYGIVQFTQDSGGLGRLLTMMRDRDRDAFNRIFGAVADELVRVTNARGPNSRNVDGGRSVRVQPVAGADLWREPWLARFREAGRHRPFQAAQNELAAQIFINPMLQFADWLGLDTMRAVTMVCDRAVQLGPNGARQWIMAAVGPIQTPAQRAQALQALHHADLRSFQRATPGLQNEADNLWGPKTHAAMVASLRGLGSASPVPIPTREQMLEAMQRRAETERRPWAHRLRTLRASPDLADTPLQLM